MATKKTPARKATAKKASMAKAAGRQSKAAASITKGKKLSAIDAAAKVLADSKEPLNCKELVETMAARKLWTSPGGNGRMLMLVSPPDEFEIIAGGNR